VVQNDAPADLPIAAVATFLAVARHLRFARAAAELGVTPTAVSKAVAQLEARLDARLFHRTTRSVSLTEAGERLAASAGPALEALQRGLEDARTGGNRPAGTLRVASSSVAHAMLFEPHLAGFFAAWPGVALEFSFDNALGDVVRQGFDVGVRPGRAVERDMVAVPIGGVQRLVVVGAPGRLDAAGAPSTPAELVGRACVRQRLGPGGPALPWALRAGARRATVDVTGPLVVDDMRAALAAARSGVGLAYVFEQLAADDLARGALVRVLPDWALVREAFTLFFPTRLHLAPKTRAFVDWFRACNAPRPVAGPPGSRRS
jgi:DNA-binding transcriptional LysR family regulator